MKGKGIGKLALAGLVSGALVGGTACKSGPESDVKEQPTAETPEKTEQAAPDKPAEPEVKEAMLSLVHDCRGMNSCKGLGGCSMTAEQLAEAAKKAGVDAAAAGEPHDCSGKNACKGLGGCKVDEAKAAMLKKNMEGGDAPADGAPADPAPATE